MLWIFLCCTLKQMCFFSKLWLNSLAKYLGYTHFFELLFILYYKNVSPVCYRMYKLNILSNCVFLVFFSIFCIYFVTSSVKKKGDWRIWKSIEICDKWVQDHWTLVYIVSPIGFCKVLNNEYNLLNNNMHLVVFL